MSTATQGRRREYQVRDHLIAHGWPHIMRASSSKGAADLLHASWGQGPLLIQVGGAAKTLSPAERRRLCRASEHCHALPILAQVIATPGKPTRIAYWHVTRDVPSTWTEWTP